MFAVVTDSTSSTSNTDLEKMNVTCVPLDVHFGEERFTDGIDIDDETFYTKMEAYLPNGLPKTSCPAPGAFEKAYADAKAAGADGVICITLAAGVSGTYNSALVAAEAMQDFDVRVINALNAVEANSMMIDVACMMRDRGDSLDDCEARMKQFAKKALCWFAIDDMTNLVTGGKAGKTAALAAAALKLKPILGFDKEEGAVSAFGKARGAKGLIKTFKGLAADYVAENGPAKIRLCKTLGADERVADVSAALKDIEGIEVSDATPGWIGSVIGTFSGQNAYCIAIAPAALFE